MKSLLFVIDTLNFGGAEKSLVSLLNTIDYSKYTVDLLIFKRGGELEEFLPKEVKILDSPKYFKFINGEKKYSKVEGIKFLLYRLRTSLNLRINKCRKVRKHNEQVVYFSLKKILKLNMKKYDTAIAYSQGMPTYFVGDLVEADKKLAWINIDYVKSNYDKEIDYKFYKKFDNIITVSKNTYESMKNMKYDYKNKLRIILDIVNPMVIEQLSNESMPKEFNKKELNILTVGRLDPIKRYDVAIQVAKKLKASGYNFKWYVIGEGNARENLEQIVKENNVEDCFILLGKRINPYIYMKNCNIYVQTSKAEGFGLSVIEAKILKRPIVCTNFQTAYEILNDEIDGLISNMDSDSIFKCIKRLIDDSKTLKHINLNLNNQAKYSSIREIYKLYELIK